MLGRTCTPRWLPHAALTGEPPFARASVPGTILAHLNDPPPRPSATAGVPKAFDDVVAHALAKRPNDRYRSAGELARAALAAAGGSAVQPEGAFRQRATGQNGEERAGGRSETLALTNGSYVIGPVVEPASGTSGHGGVTARLRRASRRPTSAALLAAGTLLGGRCGDRGTPGRRAARRARSVGRVTATDVRDAVEAFATAYTREDDEALSTLLAREVSRITPSDAQRGRESVVREYRRQFAENPTERYVLTDLLVRPGAIGRASGRYVVSRLGREPITGRVAFGVQREQGRPRVGLIAATPDR